MSPQVQVRNRVPSTRFVEQAMDYMETYRGCQKNVPIEGRFSATNPYAAILFSEHYYDKWYKQFNRVAVGVDCVKNMQAGKFSHWMAPQF